MRDQNLLLWPKPRRSRRQRIVDAFVYALELMGRYQVDSPSADYYRNYPTEAGSWDAYLESPSDPYWQQAPRPIRIMEHRRGGAREKAAR